MYIIFLGILCFLVLVSFFDRALVSLSMVGILILLGLLIRKVRQLTATIDTLEQRFDSLSVLTSPL